MNEFIILLRPYPIVQDSLILNSRTAGILNNSNKLLNVCLPALASAAASVSPPARHSFSDGGCASACGSEADIPLSGPRLPCGIHL
jgi:hypothetical protein